MRRTCTSPPQGYEAKLHNNAFDYCMRHFMNRTVHAGEAFGPESIFQAISRCHAERIGHGYHLFNSSYVTCMSVTVPARRP
jgi:adenosine deaminase